MISALATFFQPNISIGSVVIYSLLFLFCIYFYCRLKARYINRTLHITLIVSICGIVNGSLLLSAGNQSSIIRARELQTAGQFFGLMIAPLTWMVGITLFTILLDGERLVQVWVSYFITMIQVILSIVYLVFFTLTVYMPNLNPTYYNSNADQFLKMQTTYTNLAISIFSVNWVYFALLISLIIQHRDALNQNLKITLGLFLLFNTVKLVTETVYLDLRVPIGFQAYVYILFFFTDFISAISLFMSTFFWKSINDSTGYQ